MKKIYLLPLLLFTAFTSCTNYNESDNQNKTSKSDVTETRSATQVPKDPHRLEVMQEALNKITDDLSRERITLKATDKYVKFIPDSVDVRKLNEMGITIFPYRLDGQYDNVIAESEDGFISESVVDADGKIWRYCVVPIDYQFSPNTEYQLIYNVFIQRESTTTRSNNVNQLDDKIYKNALLKSMVLTGNLSEKTTRSGSEWQPSVKATFEVGDSENKNIREVPAVGLKIQVRSYTKYENDVNKDIIGQAYTDKNGETGPICTATGPIFYDMLYQDARWQLHNGNKPNDNLVVQGVIPHLLKMTYNFYDGHHFGSFAAITRALHAYYYENYNLAAGLGKPTEQINVGVCPDPYGFAFGNTYTGRFIPALDKIECPMLVFAGQKNTTREKPTRELMEITFHELGHASHYKVQKSNYHSRGDEKDGESWANGVEYIYMKSYFGDGYSSSIGGSSYTDLVECLLKNGFSLAQIQSGFASSSSWDTWKTKMIEQNSNIPK